MTSKYSTPTLKVRFYDFQEWDSPDFILEVKTGRKRLVRKLATCSQKFSSKSDLEYRFSTFV